MDRFQEMRIFIRILERRSFTQAADDLQIPRATVTNAMKRRAHSVMLPQRGCSESLFRAYQMRLRDSATPWQQAI